MVELPNTGKTGDASRIDFFKPETYKNNNLEKHVDKAISLPVDNFQSGQWKADYKPGDIPKYQQTLGGKPVESYDPKGFFKELGLPEGLKAPGRTDNDMFRAFKLVDYKPDPQYFPGPKWLASPVQKLLVTMGKHAPDLTSKLDELATKKVITKMEKADTVDPHPFGKETDIIKGEKSSQNIQERYFGITAKGSGQSAWEAGVHTGSPSPTHDGTEKFGTYDIALMLGFTEDQAKNMAVEDYDVDENDTHYKDPKDPSKPRVTHSGTGGDHGDLAWHYNRNKDGQEDSRITAAKVHLERAVNFAKEGHFETAEKEIGIGLHSLQDIFSHGQITPINHIVVGEFPDYVKWNPVGMYETALATEAYLKKYLDKVGIKPADHSPEINIKAKPLKDFFSYIPGADKNKEAHIGKVVTGNAPVTSQLQLANKLNEFPAELLSILSKNEVKIYLGKEGTKLTALGFGSDLDKDGKVTEGKWVDVNKDKKQQHFETESKLADGRNWNDLPAAFNSKTRMIFLSASVLKDGTGLDEKLKHEITHAVDFILQNDPKLKDKWQTYLNKNYEAARRRGDIAFDQSNPHEYLADQ